MSAGHFETDYSLKFVVFLFAGYLKMLSKAEKI
jgi:hypothetical protein